MTYHLGLLIIISLYKSLKGRFFGVKVGFDILIPSRSMDP